MAHWMDVTGYHEGAEQAFEIESPNLRIVVSQLLGVPDTWFLTCRVVDFDQLDLQTCDVEEAKQKALRLVVNRTAKIASYAKAMADSNKYGC